MFDALLNELPSGKQTIPDYSSYFGDYIANFEPYDNTRFTFKMQGRKPALNIPGQTLYLLRHMDDEGKFYFEVTDQVAISFSTEPSGRVTGMTLHEAGEDLHLVVAKDELDVSSQNSGLKDSEEFQSISGMLNVDSQKQALEAMGEAQLSGTLFQRQSGVSGDFRLTINEHYFAIFQDFGKYGSIETRVSGEERMNRRLRHNYALKGKYLEQALREHPLHFLYWDTLYNDLSIGTSEESEDFITLILKSKALPEAKAILNSKTSVVERISFPFIDPVWGQYPRTISYTDYKLVAGVNIPHRIEIDDHETGITLLTVEKVTCSLCDEK